MSTKNTFSTWLYASSSVAKNVVKSYSYKINNGISSHGNASLDGQRGTLIIGGVQGILF